MYPDFSVIRGLDLGYSEQWFSGDDGEGRVG